MLKLRITGLKVSTKNINNFILVLEKFTKIPKYTLLKVIVKEMGIDVRHFYIRMTTLLKKHFKSLIIFLERPDEI